ncbi:MAG: hypothetical protein ACFB51_03405 [Anaerolineae bacterium]
MFNADLSIIPETPFYLGRLAGFELLLCPNDIAEVNAEKNRIQLRFTVPDIEAVVRLANATRTPPTSRGASLTRMAIPSNCGR